MHYIEELKNMVFRNNKIKFLVRLVILALGLFLLLYAAVILKNGIRSFFAIIFCIASVWEFMIFLNRQNRDFESFINALLYEDFSNFYSKDKEHESDIYKLFNQLNTKYRTIAYEKELQHSLLHTIIKNISIGILVLKDKGEIMLINDYLLQLLNLKKLNSFAELENVSKKLKDEIENLTIDKSQLVELVISGEILRLSLNKTFFKLDGLNYQLISLQDINYEMDEQEITAWQKLIRVLTHEIMNSVTPISSLTSSLSGILEQAVSNEKIETKQLNYLSKGLHAVQDRSEGLLKFTEAYKKLTQIRHPEYEIIPLENLFGSVLLLHKADMDRLGIRASYDIQKNMELLADKAMIEQILINLVNNAVQAHGKSIEPFIELKAFTSENRKIIQVIDNGAGIPEEKIDKIFIPFFTTKEKGSGIGLSFARQVMRLHKGSITVKSSKNKTIFTLKF